MNKFIKFLESKNSVMLFLLLSLSSMIVHTAMVYYIEDGEHWYDIIFSLSFSIAFDIAVIYFVLRGNQWIPYLLSACQVYMNYLHYDQMDGEVTNAAIFLSFVLPFIIAAFSHDIFKRNKEEAQLVQKEKEYQLELDRAREELAIIYKTHGEGISQLMQLIDQVDENRRENFDACAEQISEAVEVIEKLFDKQEESSKFAEQMKSSLNKAVLTLNNLSDSATESKKPLFLTGKEDILE